VIEIQSQLWNNAWKQLLLTLSVVTALRGQSTWGVLVSKEEAKATFVRYGQKGAIQFSALGAHQVYAGLLKVLAWEEGEHDEPENDRNDDEKCEDRDNEQHPDTPEDKQPKEGDANERDPDGAADGGGGAPTNSEGPPVAHHCFWNNPLPVMQLGSSWVVVA
jgi:hypothetical protein